jgi:hypothetical protein
MASPPPRAPRPPGASPAQPPASGNGAANVSAPRQQLAAAIAAARSAQDAVDKATAALDKATHAVWDAEEALELAEQNMASARDAAGTAAMESFMVGVKPNGSAALRASRLARDEAEDALATSRSAVAKLTAALPDKRKDLERASWAVTVAARAVVKSEAGDHLAIELRAALERVGALRAQVYWLYSNSACSDSRERSEYEGKPLITDAREDSPTATLLRDCLGGRGFDEQHAAFKSWEAAFGALMQSADAKLPPVTSDGRAGP